MNAASYSSKINTAYNAVKDQDIGEAYKIESFKLILASILPDKASIKMNVLESNLEPSEQPSDEGAATTQAGWQALVSRKFGIDADQVLQLFHLEGEDSLRLLVETKLLPKAQSTATKEIATLVSAGRVAAKIDTASTDIDIIREECSYYGKLDSKNFTGALKQMKPGFKLDMKTKDLTVLAPGFNSAAALAKKYLETAK